MPDIKAVELLEQKLAALARSHEMGESPINRVVLNMEIRNIAKAMQEIIDDTARLLEVPEYARGGTVEAAQRARALQHKQTLDQLVEKYSVQS